MDVSDNDQRSISAIRKTQKKRARARSHSSGYSYSSGDDLNKAPKNHRVRSNSDENVGDASAGDKPNNAHSLSFGDSEGEPGSDNENLIDNTKVSSPVQETL